MRCEEIRELLLSDYLDGELSAQMSTAVKEHLAGCKTCTELEARIRLSAVEPFRGLEPVKPAESVWRNISESIKAPTRPERKISPRPVFLAATIAVLLVAAAFLMHHSYAEKKDIGLYIEEEIGYLSSLDTNGSDNYYGTLADIGVITNELYSKGNFSRSMNV